MKKIIVLSLAICLVLSFASCKADKTDDFSQYDITHVEGIVEENGITTITDANYNTYKNVDQLFNGADYVVVATPIETFEESEQVWLDKSANKTDDFSKIDVSRSYTKRKIKIEKVYKGDEDTEELIFCESIVTDDNGKMNIYFKNDYPLVKGERYLLFVSRSTVDDSRYFPLITQGVYSLDSDKNTSNLIDEVKERFKEDFEK